MIEILPLWSLQNLIYFSTKDSAQSSLHSQYFIDKRKWCIKMVRNIALGSDQSNIEQKDDFYQFNYYCRYGVCDLKSLFQRCEMW